ncbi:ABC transporter permease [Aurantivibrio plasticivorans]
MLNVWVATIKKEALLLCRDLHGLSLLFVMPAVFIVIMSLAMQQNFSSRNDNQLTVLLVDHAVDEDSARLVDMLSESGAFRFVEPDNRDKGFLLEELRRDNAAIALSISPVDSEEDDNTLSADIVLAPSTTKPSELIFVSAVNDALRGIKADRMMQAFSDSTGEELSIDDIANVNVSVEYAYSKQEGVSPTAVQQNVPAWLVFSMFFIVIPLSNTFVNERNLGTLRRIATIDVSPLALLVGKLVPYFVIMQFQVVLMLLIGRFLVPLLGGEALVINGSMALLAVVSAAVSIAALGYSALIATIAKTTEQATTLGGAGNIILAAIGGIMVPKFVMPLSMQSVSNLSPMSWGLEGFLDVLLRSGGFAMVWPKVAVLAAFGATLIVISYLLLMKRMRF